jgi:hypothetical protein
MSAIQAPNINLIGACLTGEDDPSPLPRFFNSEGLDEASFVYNGVGDYTIITQEPINPIASVFWGVDTSTGSQIDVVPDFVDPLNPDTSPTQLDITAVDAAGVPTDPGIFFIWGATFKTGDSAKITDFIPVP